MKTSRSLITTPFLLSGALTLLTLGCGGDSSGGSMASKGKKIYEVQCLMCHQAEGEGIPDLQPPLAASEVVLGDPGRLVHWIVGGSAAKEGQSEYSNFMPPFSMLSDEDVAAVVTYIRTSFGNQATPLEPAQVTTLREELAAD